MRVHGRKSQAFRDRPSVPTARRLRPSRRTSVGYEYRSLKRFAQELGAHKTASKCLTRAQRRPNSPKSTTRRHCSLIRSNRHSVLRRQFPGKTGPWCTQARVAGRLPHRSSACDSSGVHEYGNAECLVNDDPGPRQPPSVSLAHCRSSPSRSDSTPCRRPPSRVLFANAFSHLQRARGASRGRG